MVADRDSGKILGVELAGPEDCVLRINAAAVALQAGMTARKFSEVETAKILDYNARELMPHLP